MDRMEWRMVWQTSFKYMFCKINTELDVCVCVFRTFRTKAATFDEFMCDRGRIPYHVVGTQFQLVHIKCFGVFHYLPISFLVHYILCVIST